MLSPLIIRANERGTSKKEWLTCYHCFSFGDYYHPNRIHFGMLRALNDEVIAPQKGFSLHNHDNMEVITLILKGVLWNQDQHENRIKIRSGCLHAISAGRGIYHTEYNASSKENVEFLQLWFLPQVRNTEPIYQLICYELVENELQWLITPEKCRETIRINQNTWLGIGKFKAGYQLHMDLHQSDHGLFIFIIDGSIQTSGELLHRRDGIGLSNITETDIAMIQESELLLIEVPLTI